MNKKIFFLLLLFAVATVSGHEFWMEPDRFVYQRTDPVNIRFLSGANFAGANWTQNKDTIDCMQLYFANVVDKNLDANFGDDDGDSLQLAMIDEGTVMVTLSTKNKLNDSLPGPFDQFFKDHVLPDTVMGAGSQNASMNPGRVKFEGSVKTIFQVGDQLTDVYAKKTNLPVDIIPQDNPYGVKKDGDFKLRVFFMGEALRHTGVNIWHKLEGNVTVNAYTTDENGEVKIFLSPEGEWMASCVTALRLNNDPQAEWQGYLGSLTWGYY